jgi:beta-galactosidase
VANLGRNSRYYSGSGIYRHVWLTTVDAVHVPMWGTHVTTPHVGVLANTTHATHALVKTLIVVANSADTPTTANVSVAIRAPNGTLVGSAHVAARVGALSNVSVQLAVRLAGAVAIWSTASAALHTALIDVSSPTTHDALAVRFGVRTLSFNASAGFVLNGQRLKLYGGCVHHDNGPLGAMAITRAEERKVLMLKAVRPTYPPPPHANRPCAIATPWRHI